jgi:hypothetical protein
MAEYAKNTTVGSDTSRAEIERILTRWGADEYAYMMRATEAQIAFSYRGLRVRFTLPLPDRNDHEFTHHSRGQRTSTAAANAYEQAVRQKWRALALVVKAKLEAVESEISTFEQEFYAHLVLPSGETIYEATAAQVDRMLTTGARGPLMIEG